MKNYDNLFMFSHSITKSGSGIQFDLHNHGINSYEILLLLSRAATFYIEGTNYNMTKGDLVIINSREIHKIIFDKKEEYERYVIHFNKGYIIPFQIDDFNILSPFENRDLGKNNYIPANLVEKENIIELFRKIEQVNNLEKPEKHVLNLSYFAQILVGINNALMQIDIKERPANSKTNEILEYINSNLDSDLHLDTLSKIFHLNKFYMSHVFKNVTGFSINQYITYKRIMLAEKLIAGGATALEACIAVGYNEYSNFYKTYRKILKCSPKESKV